MFERVIIGVDGEAGGQDAIMLAKRLAHPDAELTLANVYANHEHTRGRGDGGLFGSLLRATSVRLMEDERDHAGVDARVVEVVASTVGKGLRQVSESESADLLVVGSSRRSALGGVFMTDHTRAALNGAPCPVAVAPSGYRDSIDGIRVIGVGFDGSPESEHALSTARAWAARCGARLRTMSVVSLADIPVDEPVPTDWPHVAVRLIDAAIHRWDGVDGVSGDAVYGDPADELARFSEEVDLLVLGSRAEGAIARLRHGSTANYLTRHSHCPLIVFPRGTAPESAREPAAHFNSMLVAAS
jgi:nucleotide-binding universal stress UspA family protein